MMVNPYDHTPPIYREPHGAHCGTLVPSVPQLSLLFSLPEQTHDNETPRPEFPEAVPSHDLISLLFEEILLFSLPEQTHDNETARPEFPEAVPSHDFISLLFKEILLQILSKLPEKSQRNGCPDLAQGCKRVVKLELKGCEGSYDGIAIRQCC
ncbi:hypothetical protein L2E82_16008 [Cichorium intybus]|uniref:Uncharacterized protein n=1 Tax=Cichorium intybus TaxID=13427 RepID=A0ACB9F4Y3_CICIN|nr:hypothetical protein L2E82_16008 [Cichorium intybus]